MYRSRSLNGCGQRLPWRVSQPVMGSSNRAEPVADFEENEADDDDDEEDEDDDEEDDEEEDDETLKPGGGALHFRCRSVAARMT